MVEQQKHQARGQRSPQLDTAVEVPASLWVERYWKIAIIMVVFGLMFREELTRLVKLWCTAEESHGWLIPGFSLYFLYLDRARLKHVLGQPSYLGLVLILICLLPGYFWLGSFKGFYYFRQLMMIGTGLGVVLLLGGWQILRYTWLPIAYMFFAIPLPDRIYYSITIPMREWASGAGAGILNLLPETFCEATGVIISGTHAGKYFQLEVAEACSGMRLLLAFVALGVAMAYLEYRPVIHRVVLLASTIPIAIFCNILRVLLTGLVYIFVGPQYAEGLLHTLLGLLMLGVAFGFYGLLAWIMNRLYLDEDEGEVLVVGGPEGRP